MSLYSGKLVSRFTFKYNLYRYIKASLSGQPTDTSTSKLAMQWLRGGVGVKCDLTELVGGDGFKCPKAEVSACYWVGGGAVVFSPFSC